MLSTHGRQWLPPPKGGCILSRGTVEGTEPKVESNAARQTGVYRLVILPRAHARTPGGGADGTQVRLVRSRGVTRHAIGGSFRGESKGYCTSYPPPPCHDRSTLHHGCESFREHPQEGWGLGRSVTTTQPGAEISSVPTLRTDAVRDETWPHRRQGAKDRSQRSSWECPIRTPASSPWLRRERPLASYTEGACDKREPSFLFGEPRALELGDQLG